MNYKEEIERIIKELVERKEDLLSELGHLPDGELLCTEAGGVRKYYQRIPAKGNTKKERRKGIKKAPEILGGLVRKEYIEKTLKIIDQDIRAVESALKRYKPIDEQSVMKEFIKIYPELGSKIYHGMTDPEEWANLFSPITNYHPESLKHTAFDGTKSRSKNELYIASRLDHYGLTYRHDCPTGIPGLTGVPDFTILRKYDRKKIYWEHLGMMDIPEYRARNKRKMEEFEDAGIVPWDNLIITYDTLEGGLRADLIDAMIKTWLI